jgi:hypothetical protein
MAAASLARLRSGFSGIHRFWADDASLTDSGTFDLAVLTGSRKTTDTYLAGLAFRKGGRFATLDGSIPWRAIRGADEGLIERILA